MLNSPGFFFQTLDAFVLTAGIITLVLEEDGTVVDTEEFFKSLDDNTHFMVLEKGQKWTPVSVDCSSLIWVEVDGGMCVAAKIVGKKGEGEEKFPWRGKM